MDLLCQEKLEEERREVLRVLREKHAGKHAGKEKG